MKKRQNPGEIVISYLSEYPDWFPISALGRIIHKENAHTFDDAEQARALVKYYKGKSGERSRKQITFRQFMEKENRSSNKFGIPETWAKEKTVKELPAASKRVGFIADLQAPFHDPQAIDICFNYLHKVGIDCLFINGDTVDFYGISEYERDPRMIDFQGEYDSIIELLCYIKQSFKNIPIYYNLDANHEFRYERYMRKKAPELLGLKLFELQDLLMLDDIGIHYFKDVDHIKIGKLPSIHGDTTFKRGSGVSPARTLWLRTKVSCIASHVHRSSEYTDKDFYGDMTTCWTTGMLMHPNVEYCKHVDQYNQGFAVIEKDMSGDYEVHNKRIYKGKVR